MISRNALKIKGVFGLIRRENRRGQAGKMRKRLGDTEKSGIWIVALKRQGTGAECLVWEAVVWDVPQGRPRPILPEEEL